MDNPSHWSIRARATLEKPQFSLTEIPAKWGKCQFTDTLHVGFSGKEICEEWGYSGGWGQVEQAMLEALGMILKKKSWSKIKEISPREVEYFLRDRNSVPAFPEENKDLITTQWQHLVQAIEQWKLSGKTLLDYRFPSEKSFKTLSLPEKIHELKSFFSSERLAGFYRQGGKIEVLDVDGETIYVALFCAQVPEGALLDWLQLVLVETFREPTLNLVPEPFPSGAY